MILFTIIVISLFLALIASVVILWNAEKQREKKLTALLDQQTDYDFTTIHFSKASDAWSAGIDAKNSILCLVKDDGETRIFDFPRIKSLVIRIKGSERTQKPAFSKNEGAIAGGIIGGWSGAAAGYLAGQEPVTAKKVYALNVIVEIIDEPGGSTTEYTVNFFLGGTDYNSSEYLKRKEEAEGFVEVITEFFER